MLKKKKLFTQGVYFKGVLCSVAVFSPMSEQMLRFHD